MQWFNRGFPRFSWFCMLTPKLHFSFSPVLLIVSKHTVPATLATSPISLTVKTFPVLISKCWCMISKDVELQWWIDYQIGNQGLDGCVWNSLDFDLWKLCMGSWKGDSAPAQESFSSVWDQSALSVWRVCVKKLIWVVLHCGINITLVFVNK